MSFMYLHLFKGKEGDIRATVMPHGHRPRTDTVGSETSRMTHGPFAIFQIDEFTGIENISTDDLIVELRTRVTPHQLMQRLEFSFTDKELLELIAERMTE